MLIRYGIYREKVAPGHGLTHAGPIYRYSINSTYAHGSHYAFCHMRIARPVSELDTTASMYCAGLGLELLGSFTDHEGFSGIMLGAPEAGWHLEFTHCRHHPVTPSPGDEDLLVLYYPQQAAWEAQCAAMDAAGFLRVTAFNPYWEVNGVTFVDRDGYRTVLQNRAWGMVCDSSGMAAS